MYFPISYFIYFLLLFQKTKTNAIRNYVVLFLQLPPPVLDAFGRVVSESPPDDSPARCGIAMALEELSPYLPENEIQPIFAFFVEKGLGDRDEDVRKKMIVAAVAAINDHGKVKNIFYIKFLIFSIGIHS